MPSVFGCIPSGSRYGNVPNELVHRAGPPFLDNHYRGYQYQFMVSPLYGFREASYKEEMAEFVGIFNLLSFANRPCTFTFWIFKLGHGPLLHVLIYFIMLQCSVHHRSSTPPPPKKNKKKTNLNLCSRNSLYAMCVT